MFHRLLLLALLVIAIGFGLFQLQPVKSAIAYKLGIADDQPDGSNTAYISKTGNFDEDSNLAVFNNQFVDYPKTSLAQIQNDPSTQVLGTTTNAVGAEKWIEVDLTTQTLRAWEGNQEVMEYPISSGRFYLTPTGTFYVYQKLRYTRMAGGSKTLGTFYNLPNVPDTMYFYQGYGIHGAYWHNNFGHPMSHGCVNEPLANAHQLFEWAGPTLAPGQNSTRATADNPGTRILIHYD